MPCCHRKSIPCVERVMNERGIALSKRSLDLSACNASSKENQFSALDLRNPEQRCMIYALITVGVDVPVKFLAPFPLPVQVSSQRNLLGARTRLNASNVSRLESLCPQPTFFFLFDLQKEENVPVMTGSEKLIADENFRQNALGQSHKRNKRIRSVRNSSSATANCFKPKNSPDVVCDGSSPVCSDVLLTDVSKVNKPAKKNSRKKGKKKGKHSKRSTHKKLSTDVKTEQNEVICDDSVPVTPDNSYLVSSNDHLSEANLSENSLSSKLSVEDTIMEKDDTEASSNCSINNKATGVAGRCPSIDLDESEASSSQMFTGEELCNNQYSTDEDSSVVTKRSSSTQSPEILLSTAGETANGHLNGNSSYGTPFSLPVSQRAAPLTDSFQDGWSSDVSGNCGDDIKAERSIMHEKVFCASPDAVVSECRIDGNSFHSLDLDSCQVNSEQSKNSFDSHSSSERAECSSQACSSNDFQPVVYGKRGRLARKPAATLNGVSKFGGAKIHGQTGKDGHYSVWQKVQKDGNGSLPKKLDGLSPKVNLPLRVSETGMVHDVSVGLKQSKSKALRLSSGLEEMHTEKGSPSASKEGDGDSTEVRTKSRVGSSIAVGKRKPGSASKEAGQSSRKGSQTTRGKMDRPSKSYIQQKDGLDDQRKVHHDKVISTGSLSSDATEIRKPIVTIPSNPVGYLSESLQEPPAHLEEKKQAGFGSMVCEIISPAGNNDMDTSLDTDNLTSQLLPTTNTSHEPYHDAYGHVDSGKMADIHDDHSLISDTGEESCMKGDLRCKHAEDSKQDSSLCPVLQKWIPVGRRDMVVYKTGQCSSHTTSSVEKQDLVQPDPHNEEQLLSSDPSPNSTLAVSAMRCLDDPMNGTDSALPEADKHCKCQRAINGEFTDVYSLRLTHEVEEKCIFQQNTDLDIITTAVEDAYRLQAASEGFQVLSGSPVAEFERFLQFASPVLDCRRICSVCSQGQLMGESFCCHPIPCISLGSLWEWYEEPGSYGLEIKVEDYNNLKRARDGCHGFRAYFVPYLSAVQLFSWSSSSSCAITVDHRGNEIFEVATSKTPSNLGCTPLSSKLMAQLPKAVDAFSLRACPKEFCNQQGQSTLGPELVFEYFESDQPQQRRSLFDKIKELIRGGTTSNCQMFGDPSNLESHNLNDLHPASWYSVAWYPIYRIPDGNFRAAFLTYHSLGAVAGRGPPTKIPGGTQCIVSPVVGLQSYNAKGERWFEPTRWKPQDIPAGEALNSDASKIVKERLRTLEQAAAAMARASIWKGNQKLVNRQPDYEFFLSRRW